MPEIKEGLAPGEQETEKREREEGVENVVRFLSKLVGEEKLAEPESLADEIGRMSYEQFRYMLEHLNGLLRKIPLRTNSELALDKRGAFKIQVFLTTEAKDPATGEEYLETQFHPLSPEENEVLLKEQFARIKRIAGDSAPETLRHLAQTIFATIIYLHPFRDGNGRTARLSYFLLSPDASKDSSRLKEHIVEAVASSASRDPLIIRYQKELYGEAIDDLLLQAGFQLEKGESRPFYDSMRRSKGFDDMHVTFLAAWRVLTPEEKRKYIQEYGKPHKQKSIRYIDLEPGALLRINAEKSQVRRDLVRHILELVNDPDEPRKEKWLQYLDRRFGGA